MKYIWTLLFIPLFTLISHAHLYANDSYMFKHLSSKDGLSHNQINAVLKDSKGFMWFATAGGGLNRYDGYNFKVFKSNESDSLSIIDNNVWYLQEDAQGNIWVNTGSGYCIYNAAKENFNKDVRGVLKAYGIDVDPYFIHIDIDKNLWVYAVGKGVYQYQQANNKILHYPIKNTAAITDIAVKGNDAIFLFNNGEIIVTDKNDPSKLTLIDHIATQQPIFSIYYSIFIDRDNDWWVYSKESTGAWWYSQANKKWYHLSNAPHSVYRISENVIGDITQDQEGKIWFATDHGGIDILDKRSNTILNLQNDLADERSLSANTINCLYADNLGIVWLGSYKNGVSYYNESIYKFGIDHLSEFKHIRNFDGDITYIEEDKNGNLWLGTNGNGLIFYNRSTEQKVIYSHNANDPNSISSDVIVSIHAAKDGKLWVGTYYGGLDCFDGKRFKHYKHHTNNPNTPANDKIWSITEDQKGNIWIGTLGNGIQSIDPVTNTFTSYPNALTSGYVSSLCFGKDGQLYISTAFGLGIYNPKTGITTNLNGNVAGTEKFANQNINQVYEDSRGLLWLATLSGLTVFDRKKDKIVNLTQENGLVDNIINAVVEDSNNNMWITTSNGVSNIVVHTDFNNQEYQYGFNNYNELDGLQNREFNKRSVLCTSKGEILLGGITGYNIFNPSTIKYNINPPEVLFTDLYLFNKPVEIDSIYNGNLILSNTLNQAPKIKLKYSQNVFTIAFSGMNYILNEKNRYAYMLEGFNQDWLEVSGNIHAVSYTSLPPGEYNFLVKAANSDGYWSTQSASLQIEILPPFWRSNWAYLFYFVLFIALLLLARWSMLRNERAKFRIEQVRQEAEHKHEMDDMKLRLFTNISHEFRTPLTLIITPLQKMIDQADDAEQKNKLKMIHRNSIRLLNLVNQLLDFRKNDVSTHQLNVSESDMVPFMNNICQSFIELTDRKHITLGFQVSENSITAAFDEDKLEKIMMNLLSNAFKFTDEGGLVNVQLKCIKPIDQNEEQIEIKVIDTGKGIDEEDKKHIFERFYQSHQDASEHLSGSGIGLHMVKEFVTLHGGEISVEDNPQGSGSIFVVTLPLKNIHVNKALDIKPTNQIFTTAPIEIDVNETAHEEANEDAPLIFLVDDNHDFRLFMRDCLHKNYRIVEAKNGVEAWKLIPDIQPDIIISDVMMPEMDGHRLCSVVKNDMRTSHIPMILLTAQTAEEHKIEGLEMGADDYITKPFNLNILLLRIDKLLETRKQRQESFTKQIDPQPSEITITSLDEKLIAKAIEYVEQNIDRSELSVEELSQELGMSRVHLYKKLTSITGRSPLEFIRVIRLKRAAQLLRESQLNVSEIAYSVGFNNPKYFSRYFKEEFNMLPSEYKAQHALKEAI